MRKMLPWLTGLALGVITVPGFGGALASASYSDLTITLVDLSPDDGIAPSILFFSATEYGDYVEATARDYAASAQSSQGAYGNNQFSLIGANASTFRSQAQAGVQAGMPAGSFTLLASGAAQATAGQGDGDKTEFHAYAAAPYLTTVRFGNFALSANSMVIVTSTVEVMAATTGGSEPGAGLGESAYALATMRLSSLDTVQFHQDMRYVAASSSFMDGVYVGESRHEMTQISMVFSNITAQDMYGELLVNVNVGGGTYANAVPEPSSALLFLLGLFGLQRGLRRAVGPRP